MASVHRWRCCHSHPRAKGRWGAAGARRGARCTQGLHACCARRGRQRAARAHRLQRTPWQIASGSRPSDSRRGRTRLPGRPARPPPPSHSARARMRCFRHSYPCRRPSRLSSTRCKSAWRCAVQAPPSSGVRCCCRARSSANGRARARCSPAGAASWAGSDAPVIRRAHLTVRV
ncbi:hypothetical protein T492DRAFT_1031087 [Pavlovales sp. CCMP2436]|nr:hypothetical protein T492DRAFT_1031087 [Pavlovales sp. CCMP2436]